MESNQQHSGLFDGSIEAEANDTPYNAARNQEHTDAWDDTTTREGGAESGLFDFVPKDVTSPEGGTTVFQPVVTNNPSYAEIAGKEEAPPKRSSEKMALPVVTRSVDGSSDFQYGDQHSTSNKNYQRPNQMTPDLDSFLGSGSTSMRIIDPEDPHTTNTITNYAQEQLNKITENQIVAQGQEVLQGALVQYNGMVRYLERSPRLLSSISSFSLFCSLIHGILGVLQFWEIDQLWSNLLCMFFSLLMLGVELPNTIKLPFLLELYSFYLNWLKALTTPTGKGIGYLICLFLVFDDGFPGFVSGLLIVLPLSLAVTANLYNSVVLFYRLRNLLNKIEVNMPESADEASRLSLTELTRRLRNLLNQLDRFKIEIGRDGDVKVDAVTAISVMEQVGLTFPDIAKEALLNEMASDSEQKKNANFFMDWYFENYGVFDLMNPNKHEEDPDADILYKQMSTMSPSRVNKKNKHQV